jgi:hypothetical protein
MSVSIDQAALERACADLSVPIPRILIASRGRNGNVSGQYDPLQQLITVYVDADRPTAGLRLLAADLNRTVLHELRHHWQAAHEPALGEDRPGLYWNDPSEVDARLWADENLHRYRIARPAPRTGRSPLSRLSATERNIRT